MQQLFIMGLAAWQWWLIVASLLFIFEVFTPSFVLACFGVAALFSVLAALLGLGVLWQLGFFAIGSLLALIFLRPMLIKLGAYRNTPTGMEALLGRRVRVIDAIDRTKGGGQVAVDGDVWRAVSLDGERIESGEFVIIKGYESLTLQVQRDLYH